MHTFKVQGPFSVAATQTWELCSLSELLWPFMRSPVRSHVRREVNTQVLLSQSFRDSHTSEQWVKLIFLKDSSVFWCLMTIPHPNTFGFSCHSPLWVLSSTQLKVQVSQIQVKNRLSPGNATGNGCSPLYKSCSSVSGFLLVLWDLLGRSSRKLALDFSPWLSYHLHLRHDITQENSTWPSRPGVLNAVITPFVCA